MTGKTQTQRLTELAERIGQKLRTDPEAEKRKRERVRELVDLNEQLAASFKSIKEDPMDLNRLMMHVAKMSHQLNELTKHVLIEL